jgi:hypothetical protein
MWRDWTKITQEDNTTTAPDKSGEFDIVAPRRGTDADLAAPFLPAHVQMETCLKRGRERQSTTPATWYAVMWVHSRVSGVL